jgi:hypothetical protein
MLFELEPETHEEVAMPAAKMSLAVLIALPFAAFAQDPPPQSESAQEQPMQGHTRQEQSTLEEGQTSSSCIGHITFSQEFLSKYPSAGGACREVKVQDGEKWARFDANVTRVRGNQVTADFVDRSNRNLGTITFDASPDARVEVNGRPLRFSSLRSGDRLSFWMPEGRVGFYAEPGAAATTKLAVVDTQPAQR